MKKKTLDEKASIRRAAAYAFKANQITARDEFLAGVKYGRRTAIEAVTQECHRNNTKIDYCYCIEATAVIKARSRK